jgi:hypothetical protein
LSRSPLSRTSAIDFADALSAAWHAGSSKCDSSKLKSPHVRCYPQSDRNCDSPGGLSVATFAICESVAEVQALDHVECGKHTAAEVVAKARNANASV